MKRVRNQHPHAHYKRDETDLDVGGLKGPQLLLVKCLNADTLGNINITIADLLDNIQRALNTVKDTVQNTRTQLDGQGVASAEHGVTDGQTSGLLVYLNGSSVSLELNDLTDKLVVADTNLYQKTKIKKKKRKTFIVSDQPVPCHKNHAVARLH
jgi:hypothetical protein